MSCSCDTVRRLVKAGEVRAFKLIVNFLETETPVHLRFASLRLTCPNSAAGRHERKGPAQAALFLCLVSFFRHLKVQELTVWLFLYERENRTMRRELVSASSSNARQGKIFFIRQAPMRAEQATIESDLK